MHFQILDNKFYYSNNKIVKAAVIPNHLTHTWNYHKCLKDRNNISYAHLYCLGKTIEEVCPYYLKHEWKLISERFQAFEKSFRFSKLAAKEHSLLDIVPYAYLLESCKVREQIIKYAFQIYNKPKDYDYLVDLSKLTHDIANRRLNLSQTNPEAKLDMFLTCKPYIKYEIFKGVTGRLGTQNGYFPIMRFNKECRHILKPQNDLFVEMDFNSAEARVLFALLGKEQPQEDIHSWNAKNIFGNIDRSKAKELFFAWLYDEKSEDLRLENMYERSKILEKYWNGSKIINPFGKEIEADLHHALNYIMQSTATGLFLRQAIKLFKMLEGKKSFISALIHDSILLDVVKEEKEFILTLEEIFANTELGSFKVNIKLGKDFGNMRQI